VNRNHTILFAASVSILLLVSCSTSERNYNSTAEGELPVAKVPNIGNAAEAYFSPDGRSLICNAKREGDEGFHTYTLRQNGTRIRRINDLGEDACSYYFPSNNQLIYTSTRDNLHLPPGDWSKPEDYPQGAELYTCNLKGGDLKRLTFNEYYEAEASLTPNGEWILFGRQIDGKMDLWRMRPDGSDEFQITHTPDWQEGGSFYMPDNETILFRAWKLEDQGQRGLPMTIFTIKHDGTDLQQITQDPGTNWAPYPAPDGEHFAFVKVLPPHNYEIYMMNLKTGEQTRLTYSDAFDGFPSISPDGNTLCFSSSRDTPPGERWLTLYLMDISSLGI
jgi:Tol biopolymer transport system component